MSESDRERLQDLLEASSGGGSSSLSPGTAGSSVPPVPSGAERVELHREQSGTDQLLESLLGLLQMAGGRNDGCDGSVSAGPVSETGGARAAQAHPARVGGGLARGPSDAGFSAQGTVPGQRSVGTMEPPTIPPPAPAPQGQGGPRAGGQGASHRRADYGPNNPNGPGMSDYPSGAGAAAGAAGAVGAPAAPVLDLSSRIAAPSRTSGLEGGRRRDRNAEAAHQNYAAVAAAAQSLGRIRFLFRFL